jgi:hypothetical protein
MSHYVIKFVSDLRQFCGFLWVLWFPPTIKLKSEILLKVALSTITLTSTCVYYLISEALQQGASQFEASAGKLKRKFWWKNCKVKYVCGFYLHFIILYGCSR